MASADANRKRIIKALEAFNGGNLEQYRGSSAEDAAIHGLPAGIEPSPRGLRTFLETLLQGLPDIRVSIEDTVAEADLVALRLTYAGTHRGELLGASPTGKRISWNGLTIRRFDENSLTVERWIRNDTDSLRAELGLRLDGG